MIVHLLDEARLSDFLVAFVAVCSAVGFLILTRRPPPAPISRRTLRRLNDRINEQERTR